MKTYYFLIIFFLISLSVQAQWSYRYLSQEKHFIYSSGEYLASSQSGGMLSINYLYNNKLVLNLGYSATAKQEAQLPAEVLKSGSELFPANPNPAFSNSENIHLMVGRVFNLNSAGTFRLLLQGGPGIRTRRDPVYTIESDMYEYDMKASKNISLVMNPKVELPLVSVLGISAGPMLVISKDNTYVGAGIGIIYGIIGKS